MNNDINEQLLEACISGNLKQVKYLLTSSELTEHANIHYQNNVGFNVLMYACKHNELDIIKYLLTSPDLTEHADIHYKTEYDWNALICCALYQKNLNIVEYLVMEQNMLIDHQTMNFFKTRQRNDIIEMIQIRDLHHKLQNEIDDKCNVQRKKI